MDLTLPGLDLASTVIRHCITEGLLTAIPEADALHLRAKHLPVKELLARAIALRKLFRGILLINDRVDVCLAAGADGVHLPSNRIAPIALKRHFGQRLCIGVSCHSIEDLRRAEQEAADYAYFSPIFASPSKPGYGPALGLEILFQAARAVRIPIIALGGVGNLNEQSCVAAGATGVAGISRYFGYS